MRQRLLREWANLGLMSRFAVVALGFVFSAAFSVAVLSWIPEWLATDGLSGPDKAEEVGRTRTAVLAALAGLIAVVGAIFTGLSYRLNRAGQLTERFTRAIDQLGNAGLDVRLGGIYALERIARDSRNDHPQVIEVLTAYVREHAPRLPRRGAVAGRQESEVVDALKEAIRALERIAGGAEPEQASNTQATAAESRSDEGNDSTPQVATDVQAALTVLGRRNRSSDTQDARLDLSRTDLRRVILVDADLEGALLEGAYVRSAFFHRVNLQEAWFTDANLEFTILSESNLRGAHLVRANLVSTSVKGSLRGADLQEANLRATNLQDADLRDVNLRGAFYDAYTKWPEAFDATAAGAQQVDDDAEPYRARLDD